MLAFLFWPSRRVTTLGHGNDMSIWTKGSNETTMIDLFLEASIELEWTEKQLQNGDMPECDRNPLLAYMWDRTKGGSLITQK